MSKVYITDYIKDPYIEKEILGSNLSTSSNKDIEVLLVWHERIDSDYIDQFPNLKGVVRYGVGFDTIDLDAVKSRNLIFCNTPDYGTDEVSDTAIGMIMNITRGIVRYDYFCRGYKDNSWQENTIAGLKRSNQLAIGIVGAGRIGGSIARKAKAIGFNVMFFDPYRDRGYEKMLGVNRVDSLDKLLELADVVSINTPLTDETRNMVDVDFISKMKQGSSLINTARGEIIANVDDFIKPLKSGKLVCLGLDVLPQEPPKNTGLVASWKAREEWLDGRVIINPHTSYYSQESYAEMRKKAAMNVKRIIDGDTPFNIIVS